MKQHHSLTKRFLLVMITLCIAACASTPTSLIVEQQTKDEKLLPILNLSPIDSLSEYHFPVAYTSSSALQVQFLMDKNKIYYEGDSLTGFLSLAVKPEKLTKAYIHVFVSDSNQLKKPLDNLMRSFNKVSNEHSLTLTLDCLQECGGGSDLLAVLPEEGDNLSPIQKMQKIIQHSHSIDPHHIIWLTEANNQTLIANKEDYLDLTANLNESNVSISVVSVGDNPEIGLFSKVAEQANGLYLPYKNSDQLEKWIAKDLENVNQQVLENISLEFDFSDALIEKNSGNLFSEKPIKKLLLEQLSSSESKHQLIAFKIPPSKPKETLTILRVHGHYFNPQTRRYESLDKKFLLENSFERNDTIAKSVQQIEKYKIIGSYISSLVNSSRQISYGNHLQAVNELNQVHYQMSVYLDKFDDAEIDRDKQILVGYTSLIMERSEKIGARLRDFYDQNWDNSRFQ